MADLEEMLKMLRALGVKSASFADGSVESVEFFPSIAPLDMDTLVPSAPVEDEEVPVKIPPAMARILKRGSVS